MSQVPPPPGYPQPPINYAAMPPPPSPRPTSVTVVAIIAIIFGSVGVLGMLCGLPQYAGMNFGPNPVIDAIRKDKLLFSFTIGTMLLSLVLAALQLAGGIGAVSLQKWARTALIGFAIAKLVTGIVELPLSIAVIQPRTMQITMQALKGNPAMSQPGVQTMMKFGQYVGYAVSGLLLLWPILILYFMTRPHVKTAFDRGINPA